MTSHLSVVSPDTQAAGTDCAVFLRAAAKIVETVAFESAQHNDAEKVAELLALASSIEKAAADLCSKD